MLNIKQYFEKDQFTQTIGATLVEVAEGYAQAELEVGKTHLNAYGICHGGVLFALADLAFAAAVNSRGVSTLTTGANITYVKSVLLGERLIAVARETVNHHRMPFAEVRIVNRCGDLVAFFSASGYRKGAIEADRSKNMV